MRIIWTSPARKDMQSHLEYLAERDFDVALRFEATLRQAVDRLQEFPHRGRPGRLTETRELVIVGLSYIVIYAVRERGITILRVLHAAQDWPPRRTGKS